MRKLLWVMALGAVLHANLSFGQTVYGSLTGTVSDQSGAVIPNADVVIRSLDTGLTRETKADANGFWRVPSLVAGRYQLEATAPGFEKIIRGPLTVEPTVERAVDATLKPSATSEVINVTEESPLVEATRAQISRGVDSQRILELPGLNNMNGLALLQPGAVANNNSRPGSGFVVNGARSRSNNFMLDGANNNDQSLSIPRQTLPAEVLGEFRMITNNFSAEFGRNSGSVVMQTSKSGTNEFHGIGRWAWLGNGLDSLTTAQQRTFNAQKAAGNSDFISLRRSRAVTVQNQFVLGGGGPIVKNRAFFYVNYDNDRFRTTAVPITTAYSPAAIQTLEQNASFFAPGVVDYIKQTYPVANDPTPQGSNSVTMPDGRVLTLPVQQYNRGAGGALSYGRDFNRGLARIDLRVTDKDNLFGRYVIDNNDDPGTPAPLPVNQQGSFTRNHNATLNHVRVWTSTLVMETRLSYARRKADFVENFPAQFTVVGSGLPTLGNQNFPQYRTDNVYEATNNWSWIKGRHTFRYGFNYLQYRLNSFFAPALRGVIQYNSISDLLFDRNAQFSQYAGTGSVPAKTHEFQGFFGDDFRLTNDLTLNLGLRYEYTSTPFGFFSNAQPDINNWAPRFGFAWAPKGDNPLYGQGRWVLRGGYAITYDQVFQNILLNNARNYPRGVTVSLANISNQALWVPANRPAPPQPTDYRGDPNLLPVRLYSPDKRIRQPYSQQFSLGMERQFGNNWVGKLFYVGTRGTALVREVESNIGFFQSAVNANPAVYADIIGSLVPTTSSGQPAFIRDPRRGSILIGDGLAQSSYHSMQATIEKRFSKGLQFEVNYTWSTFINDSDDILGGQANRTLPSVPFNLRLDRARSGFDQPHRLAANYVYAFPNWMSSSGFWNRVAGGWQVSGLVVMAQGTPYTLLNANNPLGILAGQIATVNLSQRAGYIPGGDEFQGTAPNALNPAWVAYGNNTALIGAGANIRRTGDTYNFDVALVKDIRTFSESQKLQLRWEVYNALNHRNFTTNPAATVSNSTNLQTFRNLGFQNVVGRTFTFIARYMW